MLTKIDLLSIRNTVTKLVKEELQPIKIDLTALKSDVKVIKHDNTKTRKDIKTIVGFFDKEYLELRKRVERIVSILVFYLKINSLKILTIEVYA